MNQGNENEELLSIFLEEAKDLLNAISATIQRWSVDQTNKIYFADLKRDLHTLKGGARMMGQSQLSTLAHELESLCEGLISDQIKIDRDAYELVCLAQDRMNTIIEAITKKEELPIVEDLLTRIKQKINNELAVNSTAATPSMMTAPEKAPESLANEFIRVRTDLLEKLNNLSIESNILRVNLGHYVNNFSTYLNEVIKLLKILKEKLRTLPKETAPQINSEVSELMNLTKNLLQIHSNIDGLLVQQSRIELELQDRLVDTRMVPFNSIVPRLSRITRQIAAELKKKVDMNVLQVEGEIDRNLLEHLTPSLEHLLRNALDHGIEMPAERLKANKSEIGKINLRFFRIGNEACIEISDDGAGVNVEAVRKKAIKLKLLPEDAVLAQENIIRYILEPGFSTREEVSEISGRGVGMDVVNTVVKALGGNLTIESKQGIGTRFIIRLPFTTSVNRALLVKVQDQIFGILLSNIENIILLNSKQVKEILHKDSRKIQHNHKEYELKYLGEALGIKGIPTLANTKENLPVLLFDFAEYNAALLVDYLVGSQEVVVRSLGSQFKLIDEFSGATLLADGRIVIILDVYSITARTIKNISESTETKALVTNQPTILVVDDSVTIRTVTKNFLERHKYKVITAKDGLDALEKIKQVKPDIILVDVEMPRKDGFEFVAELRVMADFIDIPIIMITFCVGEEHKDRAQKLRINKFMNKPYQEDDLLEAIEMLLGKKE